MWLSTTDGVALFSSELPEGETLPDWEIVKGSTSGQQPSSFTSQFGLEQLPHLILVDRNGNTVSINPPANQLETLLDQLVR